VAKPKQPPLYWGLTPNQVVAYNLARAREWKSWTQQQAADALAPYLGTRWSKANFSAAERSVAGKHIRNFDADEVVAFARAFGLPVGWFYLPPPPWADGLPVKLVTPDAGQFGQELSVLVDLVFGEPEHQAVMELRLREFLDQLGTRALTDAQHQIANLASARITEIVRKSVGDLDQWQISLRSIANHLEDLEARATRALSIDATEGGEQ
jgi:hypothetical protein